MILRILIVTCLTFAIYSCSKKEEIYSASKNIDPFKTYEEGFQAFEKNQFFFAHKKFSESELSFKQIEYASKSALMSSFSLYAINFYSQAEENLERFLKTYPADKNVIYAHYLLAIIYFEQISDEKKDLAPLLKADKKIDFFLNQFPESDYAIDLKFKKNLIQSQLASKELFVAKYYISVKKWIPAVNRLKLIVEKYSSTIYIEEALHRLVEIYYYLNLQNEAKKYARLLGYNYNSSEWYEESYKLLNKDYSKNKITEKKESTKEKDNLIKKIIKMIK